MGLSNEERSSGLYAVVDGLSLQGAELGRLVGDGHQSSALYGESGDLSVRIAEECAGLWSLMLGGQSNSVHWLLGSSSGNVLRHGDSSPWGCALFTRMEEFKAAQKCKQEEHEDDEDGDEDVTRRFCAFDHMLSIDGILAGHGRDLACVFRIYGLTESAVYYLRRYRDEFLAALPQLDRALSTIQGLCYGIFRRNEEFLRVYLVHATSVVIYGNEHYQFQREPDVVVQWLAKENVHHDIAWAMTRECGMDRVVKTHKWLMQTYLEAARKPEAIMVERICAALILSGPRYHYEHQHRSLLKLAEANGLDLFHIRSLLKTATRMHQKEDTRAEEHRSDSRELDIHGY
jgi:hypothetical protein